ncbi:MAG TPA: pilus assembly protein PilM [Synergistaceae bacterium]|nr:pilus assembly protein PilM [Synergistaceae bacterium]HPJ26925.1 pilus assembly protein PilM [Synergistaceae bacterium]
MGLPFLRKAPEGGAGISFHDNEIRYVELSGQGGSYRLEASSFITSPTPVLEQGMLRDVKILEPLVGRLGEELEGNFPMGITLGLPPRNVMLRVVTIPEMDIEDARGALQWDFEKYFPFPANEAVYDIVDISADAGEAPGEMKLLVAAARSRLVEQFISLFSTLDAEISSVEPSLIGAFRSILGPVPGFSGGYLMLLLEDSSTQLILGSGSSALLFRTLLVGLGEETTREDSLDSIVREVRSTLGFVKGQFRDVMVNSLVLAGSHGEDAALQNRLREELGELSLLSFPLWNTWGMEAPPVRPQGWEYALGLALRDVIA